MSTTHQKPTATPAAAWPPRTGRVPLRARQRRALEAICDTFAPGGDGLPSATEMGVPGALLDAVALNPREAERKQVARLLGLWDTSLLTALGGGGLHRFSALSQRERERVLLGWADSRIVQRRAAFQALRKGVLLCYYGLPGPDGKRSPVWDALGYPGPLGPPKDPPPKTIRPLAVDVDTELECDVCVVGSGAGGGVAAAVLAKAGLDVVVVEAGDYFAEADFDGDELRGFGRLYLNGGGMASHDQSISLAAASCLGGTTVVNYTFSLRTPDKVRAEWARLGVPEATSDAFDRSLDTVLERISTNVEHNVPSLRDRAIKTGLDRLGWHVEAMPRNVRGCREEVCRLCHYGCQIGAKQSTLKTWLQDAHDAGARIVVRTRAARVLHRGGAVTGVEAHTSEGHRVSVRAKAVVAACGALQTPVLLKRSGLANRNIGRHLKLHPVMAVWGQFDVEIRPWEGMMAGLYCDEHADMDDGHGVRYEHMPIPPSLLLVLAPWRGGAHSADLMRALPFTCGVGVWLRDRDGGDVRVGRDGLPIVRWRLSDYDRDHMHRGVEGAARITEAMGARRIYSSHAKWVAFEPGRDGDIGRLVRDADACGWGAGQAQPLSGHIMGSARMGDSPQMSACNPRGETWDVRNLLVFDGSAFPTASGANPMVSIEALAHMNATALAERLA
jgi:choline dehydrogenase-like flavoprotein